MQPLKSNTFSPHSYASVFADMLWKSLEIHQTSWKMRKTTQCSSGSSLYLHPLKKVMILTNIAYFRTRISHAYLGRNPFAEVFFLTDGIARLAVWFETVN